MKKLLLGATTLVLAIGFSGCAGNYEPVPNMAKLNVEITDSKWDGQTIPKGQECRVLGGKGFMPTFSISNIPKGTNAIILEMNDEDNQLLSNNGGHGKIGYWITTKSSTVTLPSVEGETTSNLPTNVFIETASRSTNRYSTNGFLPPCSGGRGHMYSLDVKAVYKAKNDDEKSKLLGTSHIKLGKY